jgi:hypothetical protein
VGDFNGDGIQDLAVANGNSSNVTVLLGNGLGGFTAMTGNPLAVGTAPGNPLQGDSFPDSIVVGDFNGDGIEDLATVNAADDSVMVLLGFVVGSKSQTITFGPLSNVTNGVAPFPIGATSNSGLTVSFASTSGVCSVAGTTVTIYQAGTCTIFASQAGNATYAPAATVSQSFTVSQE